MPQGFYALLADNFRVVTTARINFWTHGTVIWSNTDPWIIQVKYSPFKELNNDQRTAVEEIVDSLKQEENQTVVVNGMPGSGKTIVAIFLLKYLRDSEEFKDKKIGFVVPQTSLRKTLKGIFKSIYGLKASDVLSPSDVTKQYWSIPVECRRCGLWKKVG